MSLLTQLVNGNFISKKFFTSWIVFMQVFLILMDKSNRKIKKWIWESLNTLILISSFMGMLHYILVDKKAFGKKYDFTLDLLNFGNITAHFIPFLIALFYKPNPENLIGESRPNSSFLLGILIFLKFAILTNLDETYLLSKDSLILIIIISFLLYYLLLQK